MKKTNILIHTNSVLISFLLILISGEHLGGFYILYLLIGLPHGASHSIIGVAGIVILLLNKNVNAILKNDLLRSALNIIGVVLLACSLFIFFYNDKAQYNQGTFYQLAPQIFLAFFTFFSIAFIINNIHTLIKATKKTKSKKVAV